MSKKILFLAVAAMLSLAACSKEKGVDNGDGTGSGLEGYLTVNINSPVTRTEPGTEGTDPGEGNESLINTVTVVFTDADGSIQYVKTPTFTGTTTDKFKVEVGAYKLYVLVNNPSNNVLKTGENINRVIEVLLVDDAESGYHSGSFFMVNERHNSLAEAGVDVTINETNTEDNPAIASVNVDRIAVKIMDVTASHDFDVTGFSWLPATAVNLHVEGFVMLNINREFNMIQEWGNENQNGATLNTNADVLQTPLYPGAPELVMDQYFRSIYEYARITRDGNGDIVQIEDIAKSTPFTTTTKYATENRPTIIMNTLQLTAGQGETTGVIFKAVGQDVNGDPLPTFYSYRDEIYTNIIDVQNAGGFTGLTTMTIPELRGLGIKVYEDGVMYYTHFILDPNDKYLYESENYYGVFRNSVYKLNINSFNNIGDDVPGGGRVDPNLPGEPGNPPIDLNEAYIQVEITINPWVLNTINIDF